MAARSRTAVDLDNAYERQRQQRIAQNQQRLGDADQHRLCIGTMLLKKAFNKLTARVCNSLSGDVYRKHGGFEAESPA